MFSETGRSKNRWTDFGCKGGDVETADLLMSRLAFCRGQFMSHFIGAGYLQIPSADLLPGNDKSLLFTNSTIIPLKKFLLSRIDPAGYCVDQPCLRTRNLVSCGDHLFNPEYMSYFEMLGVMTVPNKLVILSEQIVCLLKELFAISEDRIMVRTSESCADFDQYVIRFLGRNAFVERDSRPISYYTWKYGMDNFSGRGVTFSIRNTEGEFLDIGNLVCIERYGLPVALEFGFGIETFVARRDCLNSPFASALISGVIPFFDMPLHKQLQDLVAAVTVIYKQGVRPGTGGVQSIAKKTIKSLTEVYGLLNVSDDVLAGYLNSYEKLVYGTQVLVTDILDDINKYKQLPYMVMAQYKEYIGYILYQIEHNGMMQNTAISRLFKQGAVYGLSEDVIKDLVSGLFPNLS